MRLLGSPHAALEDKLMRSASGVGPPLRTLLSAAYRLGPVRQGAGVRALSTVPGVRPACSVQGHGTLMVGRRRTW